MYVCDDDIVGVCEKQIMELEAENDRLQAEIVQLKNDLRIMREARQFFYKDAEAEHMRAERLQAELNHLRAQLATHTNPEDTYRNDFDGNDRIEKAPADFQSEYLKNLEKTTYIGLRGIKTY